MSVDTVNLKDGVRFTQAVVAVCDDQDGRPATSDAELVSSFKFDANYKPIATVLFKLSVAFSEKDTLYLQFSPRVIKSLEKTTCDEQDDNPPRCFNTIKRLLNGHSSFTRLRFHLRSRGQLIVPGNFDCSRLADRTNPTSASITHLAAASTFSLYMPQNVLPKTKCDVFLEAVKHSSAMTESNYAALDRMTDLRTMYNGKGGKLFSIEGQHQLLSSISGAIVPTVAIDPPSYGPPPDYNVEEQNSLLPLSQESTASESDDATIATLTPPRYRRNHEGFRPEKLVDVKRHRDWSSENDGGNESGSWDRHRKKRALRQLEAPSVDLSQAERTIEALKCDLQEQIEQVKAEVEKGKRREAQLLIRIESLQDQVDDQQNEIDMLRSNHNEFESGQHQIGDAVETLEAQVDDLERECEVVKANWVEAGKEVLEDGINALVEQYFGERVRTIESDVKNAMRRALDN